ncbi:MAG TPA: low molecular weight protein-tyrosine-phosphatase [Burkholderiaceae bacterium]|nr:low molecular weight protein-tyrosine-phosphatase [Burkholderiaceae bacterium]
MTELIRVLMVCTGNICRSPTAEGVLRRKLADAGLERQVEVRSAGTVDYHAGSPPDHRAQQTALRRGYDLSKQRARALRTDDFERFDLVVAMDIDHLDRMVEMCPGPLADRMRLLMDYSPKRPRGTGVPDPYYGAPAGFERVLDMIEEACDGLVAELRVRLGSAL